ncbi:hypothetical protein AB6D11_06355 [Vibrio splendidus]
MNITQRQQIYEQHTLVRESIGRRRQSGLHKRLSCRGIGIISFYLTTAERNLHDATSIIAALNETADHHTNKVPLNSDQQPHTDPSHFDGWFICNQCSQVLPASMISSGRIQACRQCTAGLQLNRRRGGSRESVKQNHSTTQVSSEEKGSEQSLKDALKAIHKAHAGASKILIEPKGSLTKYQ